MDCCGGLLRLIRAELNTFIWIRYELGLCKGLRGVYVADVAARHALCIQTKGGY